MLTVVNIVVYAVSLPLTAALTTYIYFDLRVRKEGFDIALLAQRIGDAPAPRAARRPSRACPRSRRAGASSRRNRRVADPALRARGARDPRRAALPRARGAAAVRAARCEWLGDRIEDVGDWFGGGFDDVDGALPGGAWVVWLLVAVGVAALAVLVAARGDRARVRSPRSSAARRARTPPRRPGRARARG